MYMSIKSRREQSRQLNDFHITQHHDQSCSDLASSCHPCPHVTHPHAHKLFSLILLILFNSHQLCLSFSFVALVFTVCCACVCVWVSHVSSLSSIHVFVDNPLCVSVPPHDVKRMAWNSTGNSSCPDSELSQSSMPAAPLGSNAVAAINNTKQSKNTVLTNLTSAFPCRLLTDAITH